VTRSLVTLAPAVACFLYFVGGVPFYWLHVRRAGVAREPRIEGRRRSLVIPRWLIYYLLWEIAPVEKALVRARVSPNALSTFGLALSVAAGVTLARGWFDVGGWLYLFVGIVDLFDGRVARATGQASRSGAFYDSVADRYSETAVFVGLLVWYRGSAVAAAVLAALVGSLMVSYVRARAEALGEAELAARGAMQRPERVFLLGVALAASPFVSPLLTVCALVLLAVATHLTVLSRSVALFRALRQPRAGVTLIAARRKPDARTGASP
jgi:CDP-diacylglycerol--glycerol-3-phosphate 3-phosphatidyltransferase